MMFFDGCKTLNELKERYRKLAMENHPDMGGDVATMQKINAEHDEVFERLKNAWNMENPDKKTTETPEEFRDVLSKLFRLPGIVIELCGSWLWISGDTKPNAAGLKAAGCRWSANKKMWYWRHWMDGMYHKKHTPFTMNAIRATYGSSILTAEERAALTA